MNARTSPPIESSGLTRDLRLADVTMIGVGAMIGAGIFVLTGIAAGTAGPALLLVFALNGIVATITAMAYAELGACFPEAGGGYLWVKEGLPGPNGFLSGWMSWFAHAVACSLYSLGFGAYFGQLLSALNISIPGVHGHMLTKALAIIVCLLFTFINFLGSSETGKAGNIVTITKLLILGLFILSGLWALRGIPDWSARFVPFIPKGMSGVFMAMGLTFIAFEGYEIIAQSGEEVRDPRRNIPLAIFISLGIVVPIYLLIAFVSIGAIQPEGNVPTWEYLGAHAELAVLEAAKQFMPLGQVLLLFGGLVSTMSALNATIFSSSRVAFAMGRDHNLPAIFARIHPKRHTPHVAIFLSSAIIIFMAITLPIEDVATAADIMFLLLFLQVNFAVITLRYRRPDLNRSFRVPLFPYLPIIGSISQIFLAVIMWFYSPTAWYSCIAWLGLGLIVYYTYAQRLEREAVGSKIVMEERPLTRRRYRILVGVTNPRSVPHLVTLAGAIAKANDGDVVVLHVAPVPRQLPLRDGRQFIAQSKPLFEMAEHVGAQMDVPLYTTVRISHSIPQAIIEAAHETDADFLLLGWRGRPRHALLGETLDAVIRDAPCDVGVLKSVGARPRFGKVLVATTMSPHSHLAVEVGLALQSQLPSQVRFLHVHERGSELNPEVVRQHFNANAHSDRASINIEVVEADSFADAIRDVIQGYDLLILGAARAPLFREVLFGRKTHRLARELTCAVLMVRRFEGKGKALLRSLFTSATLTGTSSHVAGEAVK